MNTLQKQFSIKKVAVARPQGPAHLHMTIIIALEFFGLSEASHHYIKPLFLIQ
jgi:hypothetical protein